MAEDIGSLRGQIILDVKQALGAYREVRKDHQALIFSSRQMGDAFTQSGQQMVRGGQSLLKVFGAAVTSAAEFERRMDFFAAVSDTSARKMEELSRVTMKLAQDTKFSANEVADGFIELGKSGISAEQIINGVGKAMLDLGASGDIPLAQSGQIITSVVQQFNMAATDAVRIADRLQGAANASIVEIDDLGVSLKYVGGVAAAAGLEFDDVATALALLGKAGIRGSTAGTSLRQMIVSLGGSTGPAREALREIGILTGENTNKFFDQEGKLKSLSEVYQIMQDALDGYSQKEKLAFLRTIFNNRALSAAAILTREGAKGFEEMNAEMSKTTAADVAAKRLDNLSGDIEILKGNIETFMIKAGTPFQEFLRDIVQNLTKLVQAFGELPPGVQTGILAVIGITGVLLILMGTIGIVLGTIFLFIDNMARLGGAGNGVRLIFVILGRVLLGLVLGLAKVVRFAWWVFKSFTPWGRIVTVVLLIATAIWELWQRSERFRAAVSRLGTTIKDAFNGAKQWVMGLVADFKALFAEGGRIHGMVQRIRGIFDSLRNLSLGDVFSAIGSALSGLGGLIVSALGRIGPMLLGVFLGLPGMIIGALLTIPPRVLGIMGQIVGTILGFLISLPFRVMSIFVQVATSIFMALMGLIPRLAGWAGFLIGFILGLFARLVIMAIMFSYRFVTSIISFIQSLPARIGALLGRLVAFVASGLGRAIAWVRANWPRIRAAIVQGIQNLPGLVWGIITRLPGLFMSMVGRAKSGAVAMAKGFWNGVKEQASKIPGLVSGIVGDAIAAFKSMVRSAFNAAKSFAKGLWDGFKKGLGIESPSYIERAMFQISDVVGQEVKNLRRNVIDVKSLSKDLAATTFGTDMSGLVSDFKNTAAAESELARAFAAPLADIKAEIASEIATQEKKIVPIDGTLKMADENKGVFTGWAAEVNAADKDFEDSIDRMKKP